MAGTQDIVEAATRSVDRLFDGGLYKLATAGSVSVLSTVTAWAMTPSLLQSAILLLTIDWITGTWKGFALKRVNSDAGVRGVVKSFLYLGILGMSMNLAAASSLFQWLDDLVAVMVILTEAISVLENLDELAHVYRVEAPLISQLLEVVRRYLKRKVEDAAPTTQDEAPSVVTTQQAEGGHHAEP